MHGNTFEIHSLYLKMDNKGTFHVDLNTKSNNSLQFLLTKKERI